MAARPPPAAEDRRIRCPDDSDYGFDVHHY